MSEGLKVVDLEMPPVCAHCQLDTEVLEEIAGETKLAAARGQSEFSEAQVRELETTTSEILHKLRRMSAQQRSHIAFACFRIETAWCAS
jgi:hypothetical protein